MGNWTGKGFVPFADAIICCCLFFSSCHHRPVQLVRKNRQHELVMFLFFFSTAVSPNFPSKITSESSSQHEGFQMIISSYHLSYCVLLYVTISDTREMWKLLWFLGQHIGKSVVQSSRFRLYLWTVCKNWKLLQTYKQMYCATLFYPY